MMVGSHHRLFDQDSLFSFECVSLIKHFLNIYLYLFVVNYEGTFCVFEVLHTVLSALIWSVKHRQEVDDPRLGSNCFMCQMKSVDDIRTDSDCTSREKPDVMTWSYEANGNTPYINMADMSPPPHKPQSSTCGRCHLDSVSMSHL